MAIGGIFGAKPGRDTLKETQPIALFPAVLSELLDTRSVPGDVVDLIRECVHMVMQELVEAEAIERRRLL